MPHVAATDCDGTVAAPSFNPKKLTSRHLVAEGFKSTHSPCLPPFPSCFYPLVLFVQLVREQLEQVARSYAAKGSNNKTMSHNLTVYYNTMGYAKPAGAVEEICAVLGLRCSRLHPHFEIGNEELTLSDFRAYCLSQDGDASPSGEDDRIVAYMHSKGTFHNNAQGKNTWWRRYMTHAITQHDCVDPPPPMKGQRQCNLCGLSFAPTINFFSGNFFVSRCSYVKKLLPPIEYRKKQGELAKETWRRLKEKIFNNYIMEPLDEITLGLNRFSAEHWSGSHPDLVPCDVTAKNGVYQWFKDRGNATNLWNFSMFPDEATKSVRLNKYSMKANLKKKNEKKYRIREYGFLAGNLYRWIRLYNSTPPEDSWVWRFYPDADEWQRGIEKYGHNVVEEVVKPYVGIE